MWRKRAAVLAVLALGGCAARSGGMPVATGGVREAASSFVCVPDGAAAANGTARTALLQPMPNGAGYALHVGRDEDVLQPVAGAAGRVYAGQAYGWRPGNPESRLIDIAGVRGFTCRPLGPALSARR
jgi:hypothetical protein